MAGVDADPVPPQIGSQRSERFARLGTALAAMASDLSSAQRENLRLRRENAALRRRIDELSDEH